MVHKRNCCLNLIFCDSRGLEERGSPYQPVPCRLFWIPWSEMASPGYLLWQHQSRSGSGLNQRLPHKSTQVHTCGLNQRLPHIRGQGLSSSGHQGHRSTWQTWETSDWEVLKANYMSRIISKTVFSVFEKKNMLIIFTVILAWLTWLLPVQGRVTSCQLCNPSAVFHHDENDDGDVDGGDDGDGDGGSVTPCHDGHWAELSASGQSSCRWSHGGKMIQIIGSKSVLL